MRGSSPSFVFLKSQRGLKIYGRFSDESKTNRCDLYQNLILQSSSYVRKYRIQEARIIPNDDEFKDLIMLSINSHSNEHLTNTVEAIKEDHEKLNPTYDIIVEVEPNPSQIVFNDLNVFRFCTYVKARIRSM